MIFEKIERWRKVRNKTKDCKQKISQCSGKEIENVLEEIEKDEILPKKKKKKLKAKIVIKPDLPKETLDKMEEQGQDPLIRWMIHERKVSEELEIAEILEQTTNNS